MFTLEDMYKKRPCDMSDYEEFKKEALEEQEKYAKLHQKKEKQ